MAFGVGRSEAWLGPESGRAGIPVHAASCQAAVGGAWLCRVLVPSGTAVVVPAVGYLVPRRFGGTRLITVAAVSVSSKESRNAVAPSTGRLGRLG